MMLRFLDADGIDMVTLSFQNLVHKENLCEWIHSKKALKSVMFATIYSVANLKCQDEHEHVPNTFNLHLERKCLIFLILYYCKFVTHLHFSILNGTKVICLLEMLKI